MSHAQEDASHSSEMAQEKDAQVTCSEHSPEDASHSSEMAQEKDAQVTCSEHAPDAVVKARGVARIEAVSRHMTGAFFWMFAVSVWITAFVLALDYSTVISYQPYATSSFDKHSMLSTLSIATAVMGAVCKPFVAKFSDLTSRPTTYVLVLVLYMLGFVISACSPTIAAYVVGSVFIAVGKSGLSLMNSIIVADMTRLKWRSLFTSFLSVPYLVTTWVAGYITQDIIDSNWRWGYGMFAIITPAALAPAIVCIGYLDRRANSNGEVPHGMNPVTLQKNKLLKEQTRGLKAWAALVGAALVEIDAFGLLLLGFAFSLILLPCSLYPYAAGGWNNPSMIAMEVVGGCVLVCHVVYEIWLAPFPLLPRRVLTNRTFVCSVLIQFFYEVGGYFAILYFTSYTRVVLDLSIRDWTYLSNTTSMGWCVFGVFWGAVFRVFRRFKAFQLLGTAVKLVGMGVYVSLSKHQDGPAVGAVIAGLIVTSFGDSSIVLGTELAAQACVPHQDMAATISVLLLYGSIGTAVGSAITSAIWTDTLPAALGRHISDPKVAAAFFENVAMIAQTPWGSADRVGAIRAYQDVFYTLFCAALGVSAVILVLTLFQTNFYLGDQHNCVEGDQPENYTHHDDGSPKKWFHPLTDFWMRPAW